jgi:hypothetical protein
MAFTTIRGYSELKIPADESTQMLRAPARGEAKLDIPDLETPHPSQAAGAKPPLPAEGVLAGIRGWTQLLRIKAVGP